MFNELDAVNRIIRVLGDLPVTSINSYDESFVAYEILKEKKVKVLSKGWYFNTDIEREIVKDVNNNIILTDILKIDEIIDSETNQPINAVIRGNKLYNLDTNSFEFENNIKANIVIDMNFDDIILQAKEYITCLAEETFSNNLMGSETLYKLNKNAVENSLMLLNQVEIDSQDLIHYGNSNIYVGR